MDEAISSAIDAFDRIVRTHQISPQPGNVGGNALGRDFHALPDLVTQVLMT